MSVRPVCDDDLPWLRALYASTREEEMAQVPWSDADKRDFLAQQFDAQRRHYLQAYAEVDFLAVCEAGAPVGRLYLQRRPPAHLVVDISLFPGMRGRGLGSTLLRAAQAQAMADHCGMTLHVLQHNAGARRLYERLGFVAIEAAFPYVRMEWCPPPIS